MKSSKPGIYRSRRKSISTETIAFMFASIIVIGLISLICYIWATQGDQPPILMVSRTQPIRQEQGQYYVPFTLKNLGGRTAESVQVIGELKHNERTLELGEQQIDFLSSHEEEEGAFIFSQDPRRGELTIRVASYKLP
ncbi:MAG: TIGR02588 family protein [Elainella sp. Prado103]|jgi:uncharacterized protein (TIGR02588 family)|nr:TIGR02588 family protein [Elainella sp. Prado103]